MNTRRKALEDATFYGERYASSAVFEKGLLGSDVAPRAALLESPEEVETVLFLQWQSWQPGGLKAFADQLRSRWPDRLMPRELRTLAKHPNRMLTAREIEQLPGGIWILLIDREDLWAMLTPTETDEDLSGLYSEGYVPPRRAPKPRAQAEPRRYSVGELVSRCAQLAAEELDQILKRACICPELKSGHSVEPSRKLDDAAPWYFPDLFESVRQLMGEHAAASLAAIVGTSVSEKLSGTFADARDTRQMFLALGEHRIGKSAIARAWCRAYPGRARYVEIPEGNDDLNLFRAFSKALGLACGNVKAQQMRNNLQRMLLRTPLLLVCDNASFFWPRSNRREALPKRVEWLTATLVDHGVPVVLLAGPEFVEDQRTIAKKTGWDLDQFLSRVGETVFLSGNLTRRDVLSIARATLPDFDAGACETLADCVSASPRGMAVFEPAHKRASLIAKRDGRQAVTKRDVLEAIEGHIAPTERLLKAGVEGGDLARAARPAAPIQGDKPERVPSRQVLPGVSPALQRAGNLVSVG